MLTLSLGVVLMTNHQENISVYKDRNVFGTIGGAATAAFTIPIIWSIARPTFVNHGFPIDLIKTCDFGMFYIMVFSILILTVLSAIYWYKRKNRIPLKDNIYNDLHRLLSVNGFIDESSSNWRSEIDLKIKKVNKNTYKLRFRVRDPRATKEYFENLHVWRTGSFIYCIADTVDFNQPYIEWTLVFGSDCYE